jgi:hypothetical protein
MSSAHPTTLIHSTLWIPSQSRPVRCAAMLLQSTDKEESHLASDSSSWGQSIVPSQQPLAIRLL